jgi:nitrous oxidase accessory protein NosD
MRRFLVFSLLILSGLLLGCSSQAPVSEREIVVKPGQSIQAVIDSAPAGSTLVLSRGTWAENLRIEKSLVVRGQGPEATVIQAERAGPPVLWVGRDARVTVEGLTIKGGRGGYISPELSSAGVFLADQAVLNLRQVKITQNAASGVFACGKSVLSAEEVEITQNMRYGVELVAEAQAHFEKAKILQNSMGGGWLSSASALELEDSGVNENSGPGLWARDGATVKLWATEVRANQGPGIRGQDAAEVALLGSQVLRHPEVGVEILDNAVLRAYGTIFQENWHGLEIKGGVAELQGCSIVSNRWDGLDARGSSSVFLERTEIAGGQGSGVASSQTAKLVLSHCMIHGFLAAGVSGFSTIPVTGEENELEENGVALLGNVEPRLRKKKVPQTLAFLSFPDPDYSDLQSAVDAVLPGGVLEIQSGTYAAGVTVDKPLEIRAKGEVVLRGISSTAPALSVVAGADLRLFGLGISGGSEGIALGANAVATLANCTVFENTAGIKLWQSSRLFAEGVDIYHHPQGGVWLWDESQAELSKVAVHDNEMCGIGVGGHSFLHLEQSLIADNGWLGGVLLREAGRVELWDNVFSGNKGYGLAVESSGCVGSGPGFWGEIVGGRNEFSGNYKGAVCPGDFIFLGR